MLDLKYNTWSISLFPCCTSSQARQSSYSIRTHTETHFYYQQILRTSNTKGGTQHARRKEKYIAASYFSFICALMWWWYKVSAMHLPLSLQSRILLFHVSYTCTMVWMLEVGWQCMHWKWWWCSANRKCCYMLHAKLAAQQILSVHLWMRTVREWILILMGNGDGKLLMRLHCTIPLRRSRHKSSEEEEYSNRTKKQKNHFRFFCCYFYINLNGMAIATMPCQQCTCHTYICRRASFPPGCICIVSSLQHHAKFIYCISLCTIQLYSIIRVAYWRNIQANMYICAMCMQQYSLACMRHTLSHGPEIHLVNCVCAHDNTCASHRQHRCKPIR